MSARPRFRLLRRFMGPRWLVSEEESELIGYSLDLMKDAWVERLVQGLLARFPETAPDDALPAMGRARRVIRGINESRASYVLRLIRWLEHRKTQGNPFTLMSVLAEYMGPLPKIRTVDARGNWFTRNPDGTFEVKLKQENWDWDGRPTVTGNPAKLRWSRFWVIIYPNGLWNEGAAQWGVNGSSAWGTISQTWGSSAMPEHVQTIRALVKEWKPAGTRCVNIIIAFDPASFDPVAAVSAPGMPAGLWEHWSKNVGGVQVPARLATARYWDGVWDKVA